MPLDFPSSPTTGTVFQGWTWDGEKWQTQATSVAGVVRYDIAQGLTAPQKTQARQNIAAPLRGWIAGLTLSTAGASTFGVAAGEAADSTNVDLMQIAAISKTTGAWVVGSGNGALDTGTIGAASWYHVFLIKRPDTGVVDVLVSLSPTAPTLSTNYTLFRRIGVMLTSSSQWVLFRQDGDIFTWDAPVVEVNGANPPGTSAVLVTLTGSPLGIRVRAFGAAAVQTLAAGASLLISGQDQTDLAPPPCNVMSANAAAGIRSSGWWVAWTNTAKGIRYRVSLRDANTFVYVFTYGWEDPRGRND